MPLRRGDWYVIVDHPTGPTLTTSRDDVRVWLEQGKHVVRVSGTERVTEISLSIDEQDDWTSQRRGEDPR